MYFILIRYFTNLSCLKCILNLYIQALGDLNKHNPVKHVYLTFKLNFGSNIIIFFLFSLIMISLLLSSNSFSISQKDSVLNKTGSKVSATNNETVDNSNLLSLKILTNSLENRLNGSASMLEFASN